MKATRPCVLDGCDRPLRARGWCTTHYERWRATGTTDDPGPRQPQPRVPTAQRLAAFLSEGANGCMEWTGSRADFGHGQMRVGASMVGTHRVAWSLANGPIPEGMFVCQPLRQPALLQCRAPIPRYGRRQQLGHGGQEPPRTEQEDALPPRPPVRRGEHLPDPIRRPGLPNMPT